MTEEHTKPSVGPTKNSVWIISLVFLLIGLLSGYLIAQSVRDQSGVEETTQIAALLPQALRADKPDFQPPQEQFLRLSKNEQGALQSLDVGVAVYRPKSGKDIEVSLVGAIHVADREYFDALNTELATYDSVLYELVAPKNARPDPSKKKGDSFLSSFQTTLSDLLEVEHQLEGVDYTGQHFVHADLSFPDLVAEGKRRGETPFTLFAGITLDALRLVQKAEFQAQQMQGDPENKLETLEDLTALLSDPSRLRRQFAEVLVKSDEDGGMAGFTTISPYLIDARNQAAMEVLQQELADGKTRIAIFYGAAHLPDFEQRLIRDFQMARTETRWLPAWDLARQIPKKDPLQMIINMFRSFQQNS